jgi:NAD(P)-dependent dehydrogenase (short-subunit alcohol dehydrogenase family)
MEGKVCVVTGANSGIGLETARALARMGATVLMAARDRARGEAALEKIRRSTGSDKIELLELDLASFASVRAAAGEVLARHARLDVLVNNAGLILSKRTETKDGIEATFGINHLGHFLFTNLLLERLQKSAPARILNVSSEAHRRAPGLDWEDLDARRGYDGFLAYARSKLANILFTLELARRLDGTRVTANALHPGVVRTRFARDGDASGLVAIFFRLAAPFLLSPVKGARTSIYLASAPEVESVSGRYFVRCREVAPSPAARDAEAARKLWEISERLAGLGD